MSFAAIILGGFLIEAACGWPQALFARIGHPVTWLGRVISACEARLNAGPRDARLRGGVATVAMVLVLAGVPAFVVQVLLPEGAVGWVLGALLVWPMLAVRSLSDHVGAVAEPLRAGDLARTRRAVSMIAGRDPERLDSAGIARTALESLAESSSDGVVAPIFWGLLAGLPGIVIYKAINTMDSMIGHRNARYEDFGKAAARLDDLANWLPARLTGALFALVSGRSAWQVMRRDAKAHRSPNAGWPEAAMAGALSVRLSGPRLYGDRVAEEPWLNADASDPQPEDLTRGLALYRRAMAVLALALLGLALL